MVDENDMNQKAEDIANAGLDIRESPNTLAISGLINTVTQRWQELPGGSRTEDSPEKALLVKSVATIYLIRMTRFWQYQAESFAKLLADNDIPYRLEITSSPQETETKVIIAAKKEKPLTKELHNTLYVQCQLCHNGKFW